MYQLRLKYASDFAGGDTYRAMVNIIWDVNIMYVNIVGL